MDKLPLSGTSNTRGVVYATSAQVYARAQANLQKGIEAQRDKRKELLKELRRGQSSMAIVPSPAVASGETLINRALALWKRLITGDGEEATLDIHRLYRSLSDAGAEGVRTFYTTAPLVVATPVIVAIVQRFHDHPCFHALLALLLPFEQNDEVLSVAASVIDAKITNVAHLLADPTGLPAGMEESALELNIADGIECLAVVASQLPICGCSEVIPGRCIACHSAYRQTIAILCKEELHGTLEQISDWMLIHGKSYLSWKRTLLLFCCIAKLFCNSTMPRRLLFPHWMKMLNRLLEERATVATDLLRVICLVGEAILFSDEYIKPTQVLQHLLVLCGKSLNEGLMVDDTMDMCTRFMIHLLVLQSHQPTADALVPIIQDTSQFSLARFVLTALVYNTRYLDGIGHVRRLLSLLPADAFLLSSVVLLYGTAYSVCDIVNNVTHASPGFTGGPHLLSCFVPICAAGAQEGATLLEKQRTACLADFLTKLNEFAATRLKLTSRVTTLA